MPNRVLIVPSNRPELLRGFCKLWGRFLGGWDHSILVEDAPAKMFDSVDLFDEHVSHAEVAADLGDDAWVISKKDSACLCYGFLRAWRLGAEYALTLSDDCYPKPGSAPLFDGHQAALEAPPRWESSVPGVRVRGLPYGDTGAGPAAAINVGLWCGNADYDAVTALSLLGQPAEDFRPPGGTRVIAPGQYAPFSEMNLCVARRAFPLMYFGLMGEGWPYRRFDDIWMGVLAKRICDHLGWPVTVGEPFIRHARASDPFVNLAKEAPGIVRNETFWRLVDAFEPTGGDAAACMAQAGDYVGRAAAGDDYLANLGRALSVWAGLFRGNA